MDALSDSSSIVAMALSCISSEIKPEIGRNSYFFHTPLAFGAPVRGSPSEYCHLVWYRKTRMVELPDSEKNFGHRPILTGYTQYLRVTDGQTDGQTVRHLATA